jgi:TolB-like protein/class 3 adenylate cyclase/tetratricopeptide (TPR) repeat protein
MSETRKIAAILVADVVGYSRLAGADEEGTLARLRALRSDLIDPTIAARHGRVVKRTGDGILIEFRSVVDAVRCAIEVQNGMVELNAGVPEDRRIEFRVGIHLGDVVEESDGDLMGDGVNIAARLEGVCGPGGVCLSEDAYRQVKGRLDLAVTDLGLALLKNIADPVRVYSLEVGRPAQAKAAPAPAPEKSAPPRLSIVVLPFANLGGDPEQEYFVDGVTESLTTDLSRIAGAFVIARNTAFTYKGKSIDVKKIGSDLNVRYVLEGSVQRGGNRLRVNVQLVDAQNGKHLWAERFDKPVADLFDMQDEIVARLATQLGTVLIAAEARRAERTPNPDAFDLYLQGMAWLDKDPRPVNVAQSRAFFARALAIEPDDVDALIGSAGADFWEAINSENPERAARFASAEASLLKALSTAPDNALAHMWLSFVKINSNRAAQGIADAERALALNRNLPRALMAMGLAKLMVGRAEETEGYLQEALNLSPRDPLAFNWMFMGGMAKIHLGAYKEAARWLSQSVGANPNYPAAHVLLAAAFSQLGQVKEAQSEARAGLVLDPTFTIRRFRDRAVSDNPIFLKQCENIYEGMRKAGVPEQ